MNSPQKSNEKKTIQIEKKSSETENLYSIISLVVLIACVFAFKSSVLNANNIPSASMIPTLKIGDYLFVNKMRYSFHFPFNEKELFRYDSPSRGDVVTFEPPSDTEKNYVKRLIGEPGDVFRLRQVSVCDLGTKVRSRSPSGQALVSLKATQRGYACLGEKVVRDQVYEPPIITLYEYRKEGKGPWLNYGPREIPELEARKILIDSDTPDGLFPDVIPPSFNFYPHIPTLFEETINGKKHYILETGTKVQYPNGLLNKDCTDQKIQTTGCLIPQDSYLVMGDNRDNSRDSRFIGFIRREKMRGKVLVAYFSINWYSKICDAYAGNKSDILEGEKIGFKLPGLSIESQEKYCRFRDEGGGNLVWNVIKHFVLREIPRMDVRWSRVGTLIK